MKFALASKSHGNNSLSIENYYEAIHLYEIGMSVFSWIVNQKENWKKQEIEDDCIGQFEYSPQTIEEEKEILEYKSSCLLNIALASQKLGQWNDWYGFPFCLPPSSLPSQFRYFLTCASFLVP
jgi:hypothetical protein